MSEPTPSAVTGGVAERPARLLTPDVIETTLSDFRKWLEEAAASPPGLDGTPALDVLIDFDALLNQFVALRHEVNLQTKATRAQQEQNAEALRQLSQAVEALQQGPETESAADEQLRPLLKTLLDVADALSLARREVDRLQTGIARSLDQLRSTVPARQTLWKRWFAKGGHGAESAEEPANRVRQLLDSVVAGYAMSLQRVERALQQQGLEPIAAVGEPFDPELMEVVEAVADSGRPAGEVLAEVRRGYLWQNRIFRYAQVSVAK